MSSGVTNLSDSKPVAVYTCIEVDASVAPEAIEELSRAMKAAAATHAHLFDLSLIHISEPTRPY